MKRTALLILLLPLLCGCAQAPLDVNRFDLISSLPNVTTASKEGGAYAVYDGPGSKVTAALFEYQNVYVVHLAIENKTSTDVQTKEYSVGLYDGRDYMPLKALTRKDLLDFKAQYSKPSGAVASFGAPDVVAALTNVVNTVVPSSRAAILESIDHAVDSYYVFRPIYSHETREGIICYLLDFKPEYPITLRVALKGQNIDFKFMPEKK